MNLTILGVIIVLLITFVLGSIVIFNEDPVDENYTCYITKCNKDGHCTGITVFDNELQEECKKCPYRYEDFFIE